MLTEMETFFLVAEHRNQHYSRSKSHVSERSGCSPSKGFKGTNCRSFHSEAGILPTPLKPCNRLFTTNACSSPKTPPLVNTTPKDCKLLKSNGKHSASCENHKALNQCRLFNDELSYSELWAGPTYCNSPPPSSLPIPKFSLRQNQSLSLPISPSGTIMHPIAKSAPPSPGRESLPSSSNFSLHAFATKDLRRILHLDMDEE